MKVVHLLELSLRLSNAEARSTLWPCQPSGAAGLLGRRRPRGAVPGACAGGGCFTLWVEVWASTRAQTRDGLRHTFVKELNRISVTFPFQRWVSWVVTLTIRTVVCPVRSGFGYRHVTEIQCYLGSWRLRLLHSALLGGRKCICF